MLRARRTGLVSKLTVAAGVAAVYLLLHSPSFADKARLADPCPVSKKSNFCQDNVDNPCPAIAACTDYFRWFSNLIACDMIPGNTVASFNHAVINSEDWSTCVSGHIPGSTCQSSYADCGTIQAYADAQCDEEWFCGAVTMEACYSTSAVPCP